MVSPNSMTRSAEDPDGLFLSQPHTCLSPIHLLLGFTPLLVHLDAVRLIMRLGNEVFCSVPR